MLGSQSHSKELHFHREAERLILPPSKRQASAAIIAALNRSGRRGLKRKASTSTIEILSEDEDIIPVKVGSPFNHLDNAIYNDSSQAHKTREPRM